MLACRGMARGSAPARLNHQHGIGAASQHVSTRRIGGAYVAAGEMTRGMLLYR